MNLTRQTVENCLQETYWRNSSLHKSVTIGGSQAQYADVLTFSVQISGISSNSKTKPLYLDVYQEPTGRWRLALSEFLYVMPKVINEIEGDHAPVWDAIAKRAGIKGVVFPDGSTRYTDGSYVPKVYLTRK